MEGEALSYFEFDPLFLEKGLDIAPLMYGLTNLRERKNLPIKGIRGRFKGLPPFVADSLPDRWGSRVFALWCQSQKINPIEITPLDFLLYLGKRGMGALEFEPAVDLNWRDSDTINIVELYQFAQAILQDRLDMRLTLDDELLLQNIFKVGTSAGGQRPKAIIAIKKGINEPDVICSGQGEVPKGFRHAILKFQERDYPSAELEMTYYEMAKACGIQMMDSEMIKCEGVNHFLTYRFDRVGNDKLFSQTLMALYPSADSYENFLYAVKALGLSYRETLEAFRRMVFNVIAYNVDDHPKNFSFLMDRKGQWSLAPAYDLTFSVDLEALPFENYHTFSVNSKVSDITDNDFFEVARNFDLKNSDARKIIEEVRNTIRLFPEIAKRNEVPKDWIDKVFTYLKNNL
jgi:serine/threonine-protein kinase HipA